MKSQNFNFCTYVNFTKFLETIKFQFLHVRPISRIYGINSLIQCLSVQFFARTSNFQNFGNYKTSVFCTYVHFRKFLEITELQFFACTSNFQDLRDKYSNLMLERSIFCTYVQFPKFLEITKLQFFARTSNFQNFWKLQIFNFCMYVQFPG